MKTMTQIVAAITMMTLAMTGSPMADEPEWGPGQSCGLAGTWYGSNHTFENEILITIESAGRGCFSMVAESLDRNPPWETATAWRGEIKRTGANTYAFVQISFATPSQLTDPSEGVPDIAAARGEITLFGCDRFEIDIAPIELYAWGQSPFEDEPLATLPPSVASYERIPGPCAQHNRSQ